MINDVEQRKALYDQAQQIAAEDLPAPVLYYTPRTWAYSANLEGFVAYADGVLRLAGLKLTVSGTLAGDGSLRRLPLCKRPRRSAQAILRRIIVALPTLIILSMIIFGLQRMLPGDPIQTMMARGIPDPQVVEFAAQKYRLNDHLPMQYLAWVGNVLQGDFGEFPAHRHLPVTDDDPAKAADTVQLATMAMIMALLIGIPAGILAAVHPRTAPSIMPPMRLPCRACRCPISGLASS